MPIKQILIGRDYKTSGATSGCYTLRAVSIHEDQVLFERRFPGKVDLRIEKFVLYGRNVWSHLKLVPHQLKGWVPVIRNDNGNLLLGQLCYSNHHTTFGNVGIEAWVEVTYDLKEDVEG